MPSTAPCKRCAAPMDPAASGDLCPACLARLAQAAWFDPVSLRYPEPVPPRRDLTTASPTPARNRFLGDYELIEEVARGGMGIVFKARQLSLNRVVAVKMIRAGVLASELDIARFQAEAKAAACLQHPNIIAIHEVGELDDHHYFSMEYVEGRNLSHCVREHPWAAPRAARCLEIIADTVHYAHQQGILHRDLKPSNVILDASDTPHLTDFGLATRIEEASGLTLSGAILGTPSYMAPEQTGGRATEIGAATDTYALGALLYEVLTGRPPFQGETPLETIKLVRDTDPVAPRRLNPNIPGDLETICLKCLEKEPRRRYGTANELAQDLGRFLRHEPIHARPVKAWEHGLKWVRRNPWRAALVGACLVAAVTALGLAFQVSVNRGLTEALMASKEAIKRADLERAKAMESEAKAMAALADARTARAAADRSDYLRRIAEAEQAIRDGNAGIAEQLLDECPPELRRWEWHYLKRLSRPEIANFLLSTNGVQQISLSMNGSRAAVVDGAGYVRILELPSGNLLEVGETDPRNVAAIALAASIPKLAIGSISRADPSIRYLPLASTPTEYSCDIFENHPRAVTIGDNDRLLLSAGDQGVVAWEAGQMSLRWRIPPPAKSTGIGVGISGDGTTVAWITAPLKREKGYDGSLLEFRGNTVQIHDSREGSLLRLFSEDIGDVRVIALGLHARRLATGHGDGRIRVWNVCSGELEEVMPGHAGPVASLAFDSQEQRLVSAGADPIVRVWTIGVAEGPMNLLGHRNGIRGVCFSPDEDKVIAVSQDGWVKVWKAPSPIKEQATATRGFALSFLDNNRLVLGGGKVHSVTNGQEIHSVGPSSGYGRVHIDQAGGWVAFNGRAYRETNGAFAQTWWTNSAQELVSCAAVYERESIVALPLKGSGNRGREVGVFRIQGGQELSRLHISTNGSFESLIFDVAFSPNGNQLALAKGSWSGNGLSKMGTPGEVQLWDWRNPRLIKSFPARRFCVWTTRFTPDGRKMVSAGGLYMVKTGIPLPPTHGEIQVWDVETGRELFDLTGVRDAVFGVAISPDGSRLAAGIGKHKPTAPGEVKLWDLETGAEVLTLRGFPGPVHGVAFSPDGKRLAAIGSGTLRIWSVE